MTDPWDEKPELMTLGDHFIYDTDEINAWLVGVREHHRELEVGYKSCWKSYNELLTEYSILKAKAEKWDALKEFIEGMEDDDD